MKIGYQGVPGSYSEAALQDYLKRIDFQDYDSLTAIEYDNFNDLVEDVANDELDLIVLPVENSTTGLITRAIDLLRYQPVIAIAEQFQAVSHVLWGMPGSSINTLTHVFSHPEALSQCENFFSENPTIQPTAYEDTAKAVHYVAQLKNPHFGALASARAGALYGLEPLKYHVNDEEGNTTRFLIIAKRFQAVEYMKGDHLFMYIETAHVPGALFRVLQVFDEYYCNLTGLNARPIKGSPFQYGFFIEVDLSGMTSSLGELKEALGQHSKYIKLIGRFQRVQYQTMLMDTENKKEI